MKVSIIIPVHNQFDLLDLCLKSIILKTDKKKYDYEIILSDSNSDTFLQGYYDMLELAFPGENIKVIYDTKDPGFSRAVNNGMKHATDSDYYVWLNSDTIVTNDWLANVKGEGLFSPISNSASYQSMWFIDVQDLNKVEGFLKENKKDNLKVDFLNGFCYIISREVFKSVGFLDEIHFPHYGSEDDYSLRAKLKKFQAFIMPGNFVFHKGNSSYQQNHNSPLRSCAKNLLARYSKTWFDKLILIHKIKTGNLRQQLAEEFIEYVEKT